MNLAELTLEQATEMQGTIFTVELENGGSTTLTLDQALPFENRQRRPARGAPLPKRAPFAIYFLGDTDTVLPQGMYELRSDKLTFPPLFIVPVGKDEVATEYEAVFT